MKVLDRYVLTTFLKNYLISFMVLVGLFIVLDMVINFDELAKALGKAKTVHGTTEAASLIDLIGLIAEYYFWRIFLIFVLLSGIIPVVAASFTLMRLSRFNELVAILAAGVPLLRVAMPIIIAGLALSGLVLVDQELIIPRIAPKLTIDPQKLAQGISNRTFPITSIQDDQGRILCAGLYRSGPGTPRLDMLDVIERDDERRPVSHLRAGRADWDPAHQQWKLSDDAVLITGLKPDEQPHFDRTVRVYKSNITPDELTLYWDRDYLALLSTSKINQLLQHEKSYGTADLLKVKHGRFTQWLMSLILLLLSISCVLTREPGRLKHAAVRCLLLTGLAMGTMFLAQQITLPADPVWSARYPVILAWLPVFLFGPAAIWLLDRVKT